MNAKLLGLSPTGYIALAVCIVVILLMLLDTYRAYSGMPA
jgi:hypothetical protein